MTHSDKPHTVIVGAGFGGLRAARRMAKRGHSVTVIDRRSYHVFTPLLYQVATASLAPSEIAVPIRSAFRRHDNVRCLMANVTGVDLEARQVELSDGTRLDYDHLVIAAGAQSHYFGNEQEWKDKVFTLDDIESSERLRDQFLYCAERAEREPDSDKRQKLLTVAVIGAGPSGVELAGAISDLANRTLAEEYERISPGDVRVLLFEAVDRVLPVFHEDSSSRAREQLEELGVEVHVETPIDSVEDGAVVAGDERFECGLICWGSGVRPADLAGQVGTLTEKGKLVVDESCSLPGHPNVFAIGDIAHFDHGDQGPLPGLAPVALQQGDHVARTIDDEFHGKARRRFRYRDKGLMATIGRSRAVVEVGKVRFGGLLAWLSWVLLHVMYLVGFRTRLFVLLEWLWAYLGAKRGNRLIHAEPEPSRKKGEAMSLSA